MGAHLFAQEAPGQPLERARKWATAAASERSIWPFSLIGVIGGVPIGIAIGDLPRVRIGSESDYRVRRLAVGAGILFAGTILAREVALGAPPDTITMTEADAILARRTFTDRLRKRRLKSLLWGCFAGLAAGFAVSAYGPQ
jgi:hypothetical protein